MRKKWLFSLEGLATFVSLDVKHKVPLGEPGYLVASVEHGKRVLVSVDKSFLVGDHDFTRSSLTPSVALFIDIPHSMDVLLYHGKVCIGLKDSVFEGSSPKRHGAKLSSLLFQLNYSVNPVMFVYSDSGPDHHVNFLSVQLTERKLT